VNDGDDNAPLHPNPGQEDADEDGIGDAIDTAIGPPPTVDACKDDGWRRYNNPTFKNQGACTSNVVSRRPA
jgi:hypothetical protein